MAEEIKKKPEEGTKAPDAEKNKLDAGAYEIIRKRLVGHGQTLVDRLIQLDSERKRVFGSIETSLVGTEKIPTENNCIPRDMVSLGDVILFGYNVHIGLRSEVYLNDVFAVYTFRKNAFKAQKLDLITDERFEADFKDLYRYYKKTRFAKFAVIGTYLYMVFQIGSDERDIKAFKWHIGDDGLQYVDNRSDHEVKFPRQHEFTWTRTHRDMQRDGLNPHVSINDVIFVETVGGDLTVKIEDNTDSGEGIYCEPVDDPDQTLDDADIFYADLGSLILLKIRPYQEEKYRYLVYSRKMQQVTRIDTIEDSCVLLPSEHGIIFSNGYYLQSGEHKEYESTRLKMLFEKKVPSSNGEDVLYVFYNQASGMYMLLSYNVIRQSIDNPIICHGYSLFDNGELIYFKAGENPVKTHTIQIWQTPYMKDEQAVNADQSSFLYKIGNSDIVRCMAACRSIVNLVNREDSYENLYLDLVKLSTETMDANFWLDKPEAFNLKKSLQGIHDAGSAAMDEFEKVLNLKKNSRAQVQTVSSKCKKILSEVHTSQFKTIEAFVTSLSDMRSLRGEIISLRDLRYVDEERLQELEDVVMKETDDVAHRCVEFLLQPTSLDPYKERIAGVQNSIEGVGKVSDARKIEEAVTASSNELEMLIDVVSNLKIDDATQRTDIIDNISIIFSSLNRVRSALKNRMKELVSVEGVAEFASRIKLLDQSVINYLDVCDSSEKCEEYLGKVMIQLEELEGAFSDYDEFVEQLAEKREEIYNTFETRRLKLVEERNRKTDALMRSAERMLKGIRTRAESMAGNEEIHAYFASDLMVDKVRNVIGQLTELNDSVKSGDIQAQLKTIRENAVRQLKDKQELFLDGENVIKLGRHHFSVNTQALDLTAVLRRDAMYLHLTGTDFFEEIKEEKFLATRDAWSQDVISETEVVYRGEYLAYRLFNDALIVNAEPSLSQLAGYSDDERMAYVREYMGPRFSEGYVKGVTDLDAAKILRTLLTLHRDLGLLRFSSPARALALVFWQQFPVGEEKQRLTGKLQSFGTLLHVFPDEPRQQEYIHELIERITAFAADYSFFAVEDATQAGEYLFQVLTTDEIHRISKEASDIYLDFFAMLKKEKAQKAFADAFGELHADPCSAYSVICDWIEAFLNQHGEKYASAYRDEVAALVFADLYSEDKVVETVARCELTDMAGDHALISKGLYAFDYHDFMKRLHHHEAVAVPTYKRYQEMKKAWLARERENMRLDEFKPRVLTSFVRNQLLDKVYLPLVGDNLAKQIGVVGKETRTDRMGLLMLISPPGYGKTTLMEYIANCLGLVFMKINGPAIGCHVTSLDPTEAPNAAAREELKKLNLSLEMGDNVMLYVDDIQHCNPEFLQKFISLCDAQRKIEGVYKGRASTYDLRGKTVAVVMAGNPYTESGEMFKVPDMLANRADTYNLGDIIGDNEASFKLSYIENALTSNPVTNRLASRSRNDIHAMIKMAETGSREGADFETNYTVEETNEYVAVLKKLLRIRDVVLTMNLEYIRSAAQADEFRTEPSFKLQGSYRNMNRMAEKVQAIMNERELETLIYSHYENDAQTLTTGAESNLLKFKELLEIMSDEEKSRWADIKRTYGRNQLFQGVEGDDKFGQVIVQLSTFKEGLEDIGTALTGLAEPRKGITSLDGVVETRLDDQTLKAITTVFGDLKKSMKTVQEEVVRKKDENPGISPELIKMMEQQFAQMQGWLDPKEVALKGTPEEVEVLRRRMKDAAENYHYLLDQLGR